MRRETTTAMKFSVLTLFCLYSITTFAQVPDYVPTDGLVGWWPFNGNANDESGNGYDGVIDGPTLMQDRFGQENSSFYFNGFSNYITIPAAVNNFISDSYSVSFWIKSNDDLNQLNGHEVICDRDASSFNFRFRLNFGISNVQFFQNTTYIECVIQNQSYKVLSPNPILDNWEHYMIVYSFLNQTFKAYKDGLIVNTINNVPFEPISRQINIGRAISPSHPIGIWNRALTEEEIQQLYTAEVLEGCTDILACNYNPEAGIDDGSCTYETEFTDCNGVCFNDCNADGICDELEVPGCTYPTASNYNPNATDDDGSCNFSCPGDLNNDEIINTSDLLLFLSYFGQTCQ